jgi:hypothetical protein
MQTKRTPGYWLATAIDARAIAVALTEPAAKLAWERVADDCEEMAQIVGAVIAD